MDEPSAQCSICKRWFVVDSLRRQCEAGDHLPIKWPDMSK